MSVKLEVQGRRTTDAADRAKLPQILAPAAASRAANAPPEDLFLPSGYIEPRSSFDVSTPARSAAAGDGMQRHSGEDDEVLVLELADGSVFIGNAARLREALRLTHPEMVAPDGTLRLEQLRAAGAAARGSVGPEIRGLIARVFSVGVGKEPDAIIADAAREFGISKALLGVSWLGTKALMWAVEKRLPRGTGLYAWSGGELTGEPLTALDKRVADAPEQNPILIFLHGTASNTLGSFGQLRDAGAPWWAELQKRYPGGIYGFEHRTFSESPIDNALALLQVLPVGAHVSLVSHSRGGLVGDLLCLEDVGAELITGYRHELPGTGDADAAEARRVKGELASAHEDQRRQLKLLAQALRSRKLQVRRYLRVAAPAAGTRLAGGNFDLFLSGLLTLIGRVPGLFGSPYYAAVKRIVLDIAKNRTNARLVPGIEAMLPDAPLSRLLRTVPVRKDMAMAAIAGDIDGDAGLLQRLGVFLVDHLLFDAVDNDLVVDTPAMLAGIAPAAEARVRLTRGAAVSHFRYFENADTREALADWLKAVDASRDVAGFDALPRPDEYERAMAKASRGAVAAVDAGKPLVIVLPGIMGSHLDLPQSAGKFSRVWFDPLSIASGGMNRIAWNTGAVRAREVFSIFYGKLCGYLADTHRVETFPYDWRKPLDELADDLAAFLKPLLKGRGKDAPPVRLLAHSMGGLVVRACIHRHPELMDSLMAHKDARLVMLGTPNNGAYSMVENLIGKGDTVRKLAGIDLKHDMQQLLDFVAGFRGALQLLPRPGFRDEYQGQSGGGADGWNFQLAKTWAGLVPKVRDLWFGNGKVGQPDQKALDAASWLWKQDVKGLPGSYTSKSIYVFGVAPNTPCGLIEVDGRVKMVGTAHGDGTVTWVSGRLDNIGSYYYLPAVHGDLPSVEEHFPALVQLLQQGETARLSRKPPAVRAAVEDVPRSYDAGPPTTEDFEAVQRSFLGGSMRRRAGSVDPPKNKLSVEVRAMDLRHLHDRPIVVGHYDQDPIAGPQALIDEELLDGSLSERYRLGMYPGPLGSASAVLKLSSNGKYLDGAIVAGLGDYDQPLTQARLTEAVRAAVLQYLVRSLDLPGFEDGEMDLATLLLGYNSSAQLTVASSMEALVRGVVEANARFDETRRSRNLRSGRVRSLQVIEVYTDTAIAAAYELNRLEQRIKPELAKLGTQLIVEPELHCHRSARSRLYLPDPGSYWPRVIVSSASGNPEVPAADKSPATMAKRALLPDELRFVYIGARARSEVVVQQRQPGVVERLVRDQIADTRWQPNFGRTLFQLMVPHEFKDAARQLAQGVLVVDSSTANLPWEMMLPEEAGKPDEFAKPLALRTRLVRQFVTGSFRRQVRASLGNAALVIGNPSLKGFEQAFTAPDGSPWPAPPSLPAAEHEAEVVRDTLRAGRYEVREIIGEEQSAATVLGALYERPWRFVHVAAHGVFELPHPDGRPRTGVLLSDGLLITAVEIAAMEVVPDLVFLSCCHLGQVDSGLLRDGNKLAASVARELIDIGVRCVVVAGWAVSDELAAEFGEVFYRELVERGSTFGEAVHSAREALWTRDREDITWGAFQAYGDPGWRARQPAGGRSTPDKERFVIPAELIDALKRVRADSQRRFRKQGDAAREADIRKVEDLLKSDRTPPAWLERADVQVALGRTWRDLGRFREAIEQLTRATAADDRSGDVAVSDLQMLANLEVRFDDEGPDTERIRQGIERLELLHGALKSPTIERSALVGSAYKQLAREWASSVLDAKSGAKQVEAARRNLREALHSSAKAYDVGVQKAGDDPYPILNLLALRALDARDRSAAERQKDIQLARDCAATARGLFEKDGGFWNAVMQADALLYECMLDGRWGESAAAGDTALQTVIQAYEKALNGPLVASGDLDSVVTQIKLLISFQTALLDAKDAGGEVRRRGVEFLRKLLARLQTATPFRAEPGAQPRKRPVRKASKARAPSAKAFAAKRKKSARSHKR